MFPCRAAWQRCGPLARQSLYRAHLCRDVVPRRLMSSGPGGSGENFLYAVLCGGTFAGALAYAYRTVTTDRDRFIDRISEIEARPKTEWKPKPWPPKKASEAEEAEATETAESASEEPVAAVANENEAETEVLMETAQVSKEHAGSLETVVEKVAEMVAETAEVVAEVAEVVAETAEEVVTVAQEVEKVAQEVEAAAEVIVAPVIQAEEPASENNGTPPASQDEAITDATETKA
ncbi:protein MGARP-like [Triplophysa rosa]|uniref:protein MGARP-like n=1 Tax=Triplophysa rosa TaxID=992332 RepID=UPI0025462803|nr:protein MGARP-like [Triplophysa rosa]